MVDAKKDIEAELTDKGFMPPVIRIDEGTAIQWKWSGCEVAHTITEATYSHRTGKLHAVESDERYYQCSTATTSWILIAYQDAVWDVRHTSPSGAATGELDEMYASLVIRAYSFH